MAKKMKTIDGKAIAAKKLLSLKEKIDEKNLEPAIAVILVGADAPSHLYVKLKEKAAKEIGVELRIYRFDESAPQEEIAASIDFLNVDPVGHIMFNKQEFVGSDVSDIADTAGNQVVHADNLDTVFQ